MPSVFVEPAPTFAPDDLCAVLRDHWGITGATVTPLDSERDLNAMVDGRYVLKLANPAERPDVVAMETDALAHVAAVDPELPIPQAIPSTSGGPIVHVADAAGRDCMARLITVVPGAPLEGTRIDPGLAERIGSVAGRMSVALQGFFHPAADRELAWDVRRLTSGPLAARVAPALAATRRLPSGVHHGDVTLTNVLASGGEVTGVIDFGDIHHTAAVCDLAATLTAVLRSTSDEPTRVWRLAEAVLTGYQRHRPLTAAEAEVLGELVIARLAVTLGVSATRRDRHRDNVRYITQYDEASERVLELCTALEPDRLAERMARLAGTRDLAEAIPAAALPARRAAAMGGALAPLFYSQPVELVDGRGPWLYAADGTRYLDAYNNVAVVGHAHPAVTNAVSRQLARLNTHSRYLHAGIVELAERILATMPPALDTCLFTTSGTEANELAWRLATEYTGGEAAIIAEHAYHGTSKWMADLSSNEWPPGHRPAHVATFAAPRDGATTAVLNSPWPPALVLADSQFTSEGVLDARPEFMASLVAEAHAAGALYLADEVQSGYGRSGPQLWRFALAGIEPDIVTLGKPMGAGYPIGAVVTRRDIADRLARRYEYFSTFAATPAAAAAGHAVLDVLEATELPAQAVEVGALLRDRLRALAAEHPVLGEVRGTGLLAGVDVESPESARRLLDALTVREVLAGRTGPKGNVLKIRPPLVWEPEHVELLVDRLHDCLGSDPDPRLA
ncbi:MAG TPA: aminotransferase class III-fold pyridoxal phosphate-dependent enzyme [Pseudonocardiaceae bacterium]|nr:aminotransferase class III-fold pyridoxal phosphate-dependent enzyme [Pseudonocardiaceae bacterium]